MLVIYISSNTLFALYSANFSGSGSTVASQSNCLPLPAHDDSAMSCSPFSICHNCCELPMLWIYCKISWTSIRIVRAQHPLHGIRCAAPADFNSFSQLHIRGTTSHLYSAVIGDSRYYRSIIHETITKGGIIKLPLGTSSSTPLLSPLTVGYRAAGKSSCNWLEPWPYQVPSYHSRHSRGK